MYIISRMIKVEKGHTQNLIAKFDKVSPVFQSKGFVKREILVDYMQKQFDLVNISTYFENKEAYLQWESSPEHIAMHKDKNHFHHQKPEGVIGIDAHFYELKLLQPYEKN
ncbi:MAG: antibiotic biosynthesis monooxygenase [Acholeplasmataceae bacterium]